MPAPRSSFPTPATHHPPPMPESQRAEGVEEESPPPHWRLPPGCTRGLWEYAHSESVATDYDRYFSEHRLLEFDQSVVDDWLDRRGAPGQVVADLGCGTGRALVPLVRRGFQGLAVDLSERMLDVVREKAARESLKIDCLRANWVELDGVADRSVDHAISLFSTLGMIRGRRHRRRALEHTRRILRPGGLFVVHVHNLWHSVFDPGGPWWILRSAAAALVSRQAECGDRYFHYRGVHNMFLHMFRLGEMRRDLQAAGLRLLETIPIDGPTQGRLPRPWWLPRLRAIGWMFVTEAP